MSYYFLIFTFIIAIIAIIYFWYAAKSITSISDDKILSLETKEDRLISNWYKQNIKASYNFDINENVVGAKLIQRLYDIEVDSNLLVVGTDLKSRYTSLTHKPLATQINSTSISDCIIDIRALIGKEGEIAIIHDKEIRSRLRTNNNYDINELNAILENELDIIARDYLKAVLSHRWEKINELNDPNVTNKEGSYIYLKKFDVPNIQTAQTQEGIRINLLCTDLEFETLIKRWKIYLSSSSTSF